VAAYGYEASTRLLLQFGADPSSRTTTGLTPADLAAVNGHGDLAEELRRATGRGGGHN
jgi:ankyrin repeat protein